MERKDISTKFQIDPVILSLRFEKPWNLSHRFSLFTFDHNSPKDSLRRCKGDPSCAQKKNSQQNFQQWMQCVCTHHGATADEALVSLYGRDWNGRSIASMAKNGNIIFFVPAEKNICLVTSRNKFFYIIFGVFSSRERCCSFKIHSTSSPSNFNSHSTRTRERKFSSWFVQCSLLPSTLSQPWGCRNHVPMQDSGLSCVFLSLTLLDLVRPMAQEENKPRTCVWRLDERPTG